MQKEAGEADGVEPALVKQLLVTVNTWFDFYGPRVPPRTRIRVTPPGRCKTPSSHSHNGQNARIPGVTTLPEGRYSTSP